MTPLTLALVLASALIHATWNLWTKEIGGYGRSGSLMWLLTALSSVGYAAPALILAATTHWRPTPLALAFMAGSALIHVGYFLLLLRGYRASDLSIVYPVARGTGPLLATLGAILWFGERPTVLSVSGLALIASGVLIMAVRPAGSARAAAGLRWGLAIGGSIALYLLWDGWAVQRIGIPPLVYYWGGEVVRALVFTPAALAHRADVAQLWRTQRARVIGIAGLSPLSYILILLALRHGAVSHVAPARELSILFGAYLGGRVLGEGERRRRLVAAAAFAAGVIALALA